MRRCRRVDQAAMGRGTDTLESAHEYRVPKCKLCFRCCENQVHAVWRIRNTEIWGVVSILLHIRNTWRHCYYNEISEFDYVVFLNSRFLMLHNACIWENPCYFLRRSVTYLYSRSHDVIDSVFVRLDFFEDGLKLSQSGRGVGKRPAKIIVPASKQLKTRLFTKREPYRVQQVILLYLSAMTSHKPDLSSSIRPWSRKAWKKRNKSFDNLIDLIDMH